MLLLAAICIAACTEDDPCTGIYYTRETGNVSYVAATVEGPGLESEWWEPRVSIWDYPSSSGYPDDEIVITISQAACPDHKIIIEGNVQGDGTLDPILYSHYWVGDVCAVAPDVRSMVPVSDGSVTFHRADDYFTISFNNLRILNRAPIGDPPDVESVILNSFYRAPAVCLITPE